MKCNTYTGKWPQIFANRPNREKLKDKTVTILGVGAGGTQLSIFLAKSGIGYLKILDRDIVEKKNLSTQILFDQRDIGSTKAAVIEKKLKELAPWTQIESRVMEIPNGFEGDAKYEKGVKELKQFIQGSDIVANGLDNIGSRITASMACRDLRIPYVDAGAYGKRGQVIATLWGKTPCLGCLGLKRVEGGAACSSSPTTLPAFSVVAATQAQVTINYVCEQKVPPLITLNLTSFDVNSISVKRSPACWICGGL